MLEQGVEVRHERPGQPLHLAPTWIEGLGKTLYNVFLYYIRSIIADRERACYF
jgi:hypothetical protein